MRHTRTQFSHTHTLGSARAGWAALMNKRAYAPNKISAAAAAVAAEQYDFSCCTIEISNKIGTPRSSSSNGGVAANLYAHIIRKNAKSKSSNIVNNCAATTTTVARIFASPQAYTHTPTHTLTVCICACGDVLFAVGKMWMENVDSARMRFKGQREFFGSSIHTIFARVSITEFFLVKKK